MIDRIKALLQEVEDMKAANAEELEALRKAVNFGLENIEKDE